MNTAEPTNEAQNLSSMADDVLRAILARAGFDDHSIIGSAEGPARSLHVGNCRIPWWTEVSGGSWTTLVAMRTNQYTTPIFAFDGEGAFARKSFAGLPCGGPGGMAWGLATLG